MNRFYVMILALLISNGAWAQKGSVNKAQVFLDKGDLINAKAEIDVAIKLEKNAAKGKTWYIRGQIYQAIATNKDMKISSLDPDAIVKAVDSYKKVGELDKESSFTAIQSTLKVDGLWGHFMDIAQKKYNNKNLEAALGNFEKGLLVKPEDSITIYYAGAVSQQLEDYKKAEKYYKKMRELYMIPESAYQSLVYFERVKEDNQAALDMVREAKEKYPSNKDFINEELTLLILLNKLEEAESKLKAALLDDPSVVQNHLNLAVLYDNLASKLIEDGDKVQGEEKFNLAIKSYEDAAELDPESYVANFNLGAIYVNRAKIYLDEVRDMDLKSYNKKGPALEEKAKVDLKTAQPYFEKVIENKPDDVTALSTLQTIYSSLKMYDKAEEIMAKIEKLEGNDDAH